MTLNIQHGNGAVVVGLTRIAVKTEANNNAHMAKDGSLSFNTKTRKDV